MKYSAFIDRVNEKVRTDDEWPVSGAVTQQQVDYSYIAALAVATVTPLSGFPGSMFSEAVLSSPSSPLPALDKYSLPATLFRYRDDLGITSIFLDDIEYQLDEGVPIATIRNKARNALYKDAKLFAADLKDRLFYVLNTQEAKINHLTEFTKPDTGDIGTTDYPFEGTDAEKAASIVATHVMGELKRDSAGAQFQAILQNQYSRPRQVAAEQ